MSQDELGEKIYVSRQTISSWENGKSYPDIHSLILLSQVFNVTIDNLVKGDLEIMEQKIEKHDINNLSTYARLMGIGYIITIVLFPASIITLLHYSYLGITGIVIATLAFALSLYFAVKVEKIKKQYDVQTYREILAFCNGETLDEISKAQESGKRKYESIIITLGSCVLGVIVSLLVLLIIWNI